MCMSVQNNQRLTGFTFFFVTVVHVFHVCISHYHSNWRMVTSVPPLVNRAVLVANTHNYNHNNQEKNSNEEKYDTSYTSKQCSINAINTLGDTTRNIDNVIIIRNQIGTRVWLITSITTFIDSITVRLH